VSCRRYANAETQLSIRFNVGTTSGDGVVLNIRIGHVVNITIRLNTNTLFGLLFGSSPNNLVEP